MRRLLIALLALPLCAAQYYVDSACPNNGNGEATTCAAGAGAAGPFNSLSNMRGKVGGYAAGDAISLKCGQVYRGYQLNLPSSGTDPGTGGAVITLNRWGSCTGDNNPLIKESTALIGPTYKWTKSGHGTNEYYLEAAAGGNPGITQPAYSWIDGINAPAGTLGTLDNYQSKWGDNDTLGYSTLYIRDDRGDPDTTAALIEGANSNGYAIYNSSKSYWTIDGVDFAQVNGYAFSAETAGTGFTVRNSRCWSTKYCWNATVGSLTLEYNQARDIVGSNNVISFSGTGTLSAAYVLISGGFGGINIGSGAGGASITNATLEGLTAFDVKNASANAATVTNSILGATANAQPCQKTGAGTLTVSYSNWLPALMTSYFNSGCTDGGNNQYVEPQYTSNRRQALYALYMDDTPNLAQWMTMTDLANARGMQTTFATYTLDTITAQNWSDMAAKIAAGNEIACHTRSHAYLDSHSAFTLQCSKGATCTLTLDVPNHLLTTAVDGVTDISIDLSVARYNTDYSGGSMNNLVADINGHAGYTAVLSTGQGPARYLGLADVSGQDLKAAPYALLYDEAIPGGRRWVEEYDGCISDIQSHIPGYTVKTLVYPSAVHSTASDAAAASRFTAARLADAASYDLSNLSIYGVRVYGTGLDLASDATIKRSVWGEFDYLAYFGGIAGLISHGWTTISEAQWTVALNAMAASKANVKVVTFAAAADYIRGTTPGYLPSGLDADGTGLRWTRVWTTDASDYRLRGGSPLINAGTATAYTADLLGNPIVGAPDIGAYEYQPPKGGIPAPVLW